jgi:hypothetical protein
MFGREFNDGEFCPLLKDKCVRHKCAWFQKLIGQDPQTGQPVDKLGCAVAWLPILTIENSQQQRQTAASVDKVANQIHRQRSEFIGALPEEARERLVSADVSLLSPASGAPPEHSSR